MATTGAPGFIPLFDDSTPMTPVQAPWNAQSKALNDALARLVPRTGQARGISSNANGDVKITHGLGFTPYAIICNSVGTAGGSPFSYRITARDDKSFTVRVFYNGTAWANTNLGASDGFDWIATPQPS